MRFAELENGTKIAAIGILKHQQVHLHIDVDEDADNDHPDLHFEIPLDQAKDLWLGLGFAIQDAGGSLENPQAA